MIGRCERRDNKKFEWSVQGLTLVDVNEKEDRLCGELGLEEI